MLLRHDVDFSRSSIGKITLDGSPWAVVLEVLVAGIYAVAQGQELPELPGAPQLRGPDGLPIRVRWEGATPVQA